MNILVIAATVPTPWHGRLYDTLGTLTADGHSVTLAAFARPDRPPATEHLAPLCRAVHTVPQICPPVGGARWFAGRLMRGQPCSVACQDDAAMCDLLERLQAQERFDAVHAGGLDVAHYALGCSDVRRVLDAQHAAHQVAEHLAGQTRRPWRRWMLRREAHALARYQTDVCRRFCHVVTANEEHRRHLLALGAFPGPGEQAVTAVSCGVNPEARPMVSRVSHPHRLLILAAAFDPATVDGVLWFTGQVFLPSVAREVPGVVLTIAGDDPPAAVRRLGGARIEVIDCVHDPAPYLAESAACVVPVHAGAGMADSILHAWCWGIPVVTTTAGMAGIDAQPGDNLLAADHPALFAAALVALLREPAAAWRLRDNGRRHVEALHRPETAQRRWPAVYERLGGAA